MSFPLHEKTAVITGAASGLGRAIAVALSRRGCHLALADVDEAGLEETVKLLQPVQVSVHRLDVTDRAAVAQFPELVGPVDLLYNNAGVALDGPFEQISEEDFDWLFEINFFGVVRMTRAFLPHLRSRPEARIINISSLFGLISPAEQCAYSASKFAVRGFSQSLRQELRGTRVGVTVVHPGGVATKIAENARSPAHVGPELREERLKWAQKLLAFPAARAGEMIVKATESRQNRVIIGPDAMLFNLLERIAPHRHIHFFEWFLRKFGGWKPLSESSEKQQ